METKNKEFIIHQTLTQSDYERGIKSISSWNEKRQSYKHRIINSLLMLSFVLLILSLFILLAIIFLSSEREAHPIIKLFSYLTASLAVLSILLSLLTSKIKSYPPGVFPAKLKITINNDGIYGETESSHSGYKWHAISHLNKIDNHLFLIVDNMIAIPISLRNFSDEKEAESLIIFIEERMDSPKATP
ncbi:YcxB family protein [Pectobacterium brasiliense]|uniref:YcxB family protein n=1 Tax=Pectobacterium brasiliense TaxID=180957 RepID=UPI002A80EBEA|nr:YcxB family protein [Pectobacterium brasiliense]MDY4333851.1 YcxB family protein [Pectobacterium brasiliense]